MTNEYTNVSVSIVAYPTNRVYSVSSGLTSEYEINPMTGFIGPKSESPYEAPFNLNDYSKIKGE